MYVSLLYKVLQCEYIFLYSGLKISVITAQGVMFREWRVSSLHCVLKALRGAVACVTQSTPMQSGSVLDFLSSKVDFL